MANSRPQNWSPRQSKPRSRPTELGTTNSSRPPCDCRRRFAGPLAIGPAALPGIVGCVDEAAALAAGDELLAQYRKLRLKYSGDEEGGLILARWCQKNGLKDELRAHASQLFHQHPDDPEVLKMLDLTWHQGQLQSGEQLAAREENQRKAKAAQHEWQPRLPRLHTHVRSVEQRERVGPDRTACNTRPGGDRVVGGAGQEPARSVVGIGGCLWATCPGEKSTDALLRQALLSNGRMSGWRPATSCDPAVHGYVPKLLGALSTPLEAKLEVVREADGLRIRESVSREGADAKFEKSIDHEVSLITPNPFLADIVGSGLCRELSEHPTHGQGTSVSESQDRRDERRPFILVLEHTTNQPASQKCPRCGGAGGRTTTC